MFHGATMDLKLINNPQRPYSLYVFDDALVIVQPPLELPTSSVDEGAHHKFIAYVQLLIMDVSKKTDITSHGLLPMIQSMVDEKRGLHPYAERIDAKDITAITVPPKKFLQAYKVILQTADRDPLLFITPKRQRQETLLQLLAKSSALKPLVQQESS